MNPIEPNNLDFPYFSLPKFNIAATSKYGKISERAAAKMALLIKNKKSVLALDKTRTPSIEVKCNYKYSIIKFYMF